MWEGEYIINRTWTLTDKVVITVQAIPKLITVFDNYTACALNTFRYKLAFHVLKSEIP